ncbi:hypothetical protein GP486_007369 [Trichoglossum hirsutum]|uniref:C2H2-type domain-containing protein n=1 Tax=Trichoglossum hirsutum TaxID=265104 RepID=A0A9P8I6H4_9PEZI|nr:hypothetical protein GP486_007369 [Trichoglossum hirsutum]
MEDTMGLLPLGSVGYADEDAMPPAAEFQYGTVPEGCIQLFNLDHHIPAEPDWLDGLETPQVSDDPTTQAMYTPFVMNSDIAPASVLPDHVSSNQTSFVPLSNGNRLNCHECGYQSDTHYELSLHAHRTGHAPYRCQFPGCLSVFSSHDTMIRHQTKHNDEATRYSCSYCRKYRGPNGFKRKDHLRQHVLNYHHINEPSGNRYEVLYGFGACPRAGCTEYRDRYVHPMPFKKKSEYTEHMRKVHNESPFPCDAPFCDRIDGKGFFRAIDLRKHKAKKHTEDAQ